MGIIKLVVMVLVVISIAHLAYTERSKLGFVWSVWRRFRLKMLFEVLLVQIALIASIVVLYEYAPVLRWGWWNLFSSDGEGGNIMIAPFVESAESGNLAVSLLVIGFFVVVFIMLPFLAHREEEMFRRGYDDWRSITVQSVKFGLMHLIVGIPLVIGIGLIGPGFFFAYKYKKALGGATLQTTYRIEEADRGSIESALEEIRSAVDTYREAEDEAVMVATAYHGLYNSTIFLLLFVVVIAAM